MDNLSSWAILALDGRALTPLQCTMLERELADDPFDVTIRIKLLGYYGARREDSPISADRRLTHIIWMIENHPEHPISGSPFTHCDQEIDGINAYKEAKLRWLRQINSGNGSVTLLRNAAQYLVKHDGELAEKCLLRASALSPDDPDVHHELGILYHLWRRPMGRTETTKNRLHSQQPRQEST